MRALGQLDEGALANAQRRVNLLKKNVKRKEVLDMKALAAAKSAEVHVVLENDSTSMKRMPTNKMSKALLDKVFSMDIGYLEDQFGTIGESRGLASESSG
jgi:hypothetical protein